MKRAIVITLFSVLLAGAWGGWWLFTDKSAPLFKPIEYYQLSGEFHYVKPKEVNEVLDHYLGHSFWAVELNEIQTKLTYLDWVNKALVKRRWPNQLYVEIEEQIPFARWGEKGLVTQSGEVFYPKNREGFEGLVRVTGELSESKKILVSLEEFQQKLSEIGFVMISLTHQVDGVWQMELLNGSQIILDDRKALHKLGRFITAYPQLAEPLRKSPQMYDLRYSNGFIVGKTP